MCGMAERCDLNVWRQQPVCGMLFRLSDMSVTLEAGDLVMKTFERDFPRCDSNLTILHNVSNNVFKQSIRYSKLLSTVFEERAWMLLFPVSKAEGLKMPYEEVTKEDTDKK